MWHELPSDDHAGNSRHGRKLGVDEAERPAEERKGTAKEDQQRPVPPQVEGAVRDSGGRPHLRTKTDFAKLSRSGLPRRAGQLAVHSEVVDTDCCMGQPFGAEVCPPDVNSTYRRLKSVDVAAAR